MVDIGYILKLQPQNPLFLLVLLLEQGESCAPHDIEDLWYLSNAQPLIHQQTKLSYLLGSC